MTEAHERRSSSGEIGLSSLMSQTTMEQRDMSRKIHLRRNKADGTNGDVSACATNPNVSSARRNNRQSYQFMASEIVPWSEFKNKEERLLCFHCIDAAITIRNRQRKEKGLPPVEKWNK